MSYIFAALFLVATMLDSLPVNAERYSTLKNCDVVQNERYVDCRNKAFEQIPMDLQDSSEKNIYLSKNPYVCNCSMAWFLEKLKSQDLGIKILDEKVVRCAKPAKLKGLRISDITNIDICPKATKPCKFILKSCQSATQVCVNRGKNFDCNCKIGFYEQAHGNDRCIDLNECQQSHDVCSSHAQCINMIGSYKCLCWEGYTGDGKHCEDLDECAVNSHNCGKDAVCVNHVGGYKCRCKPGFKLNRAAKNGHFCIKTETAGKSLLIIAVIGGVSSVLLLVLVTIFFCRRKMSSRKRQSAVEDDSPSQVLASEHDSRQQEPFLQQDQETVQQQMFMFNNYFDDVSVPTKEILPNPSSLTTWSEDDEEEEYSDFDKGK